MDNQNQNNAPVQVTKEEVDEIMKVIISEAKNQGYQEAMKIYIRSNAVIWRRGFLAGVIFTAVAAVGIIFGKKKYDEHLKKEALRKEPLNVDEAEDVKFEDFEA